MTVSDHDGTELSMAPVEETRAPSELDHLAPGAGHRRLVLIPVGGFDRRTVQSVEVARQLPAAECRAIHVSTNRRALWRLGEGWQGIELGVPLLVVDDEGGVAATVAQHVAAELAGAFDEVVLIVGRMALRGRYHRLLHDGTGEAIAQAVEEIPNATVAMLTVSVL
jgi:hypothetical protein